MEQKKILSRCPLFSGLTEAEMGAVLREMQVKEKDYEKGEILLFAGEVPRDFGIVLEGGIVILKNSAAARLFCHRGFQERSSPRRLRHPGSPLW